MTALIEWTSNGATLAVELDLVDTEAFESTAEVTEHPVETGSAVTDHVKPANDSIVIEGMISNTPVVVPATQMGGVTRAPQAIDLAHVGAVTVQRWSAPFRRVIGCRELLHQLVKAGVPATLSTGGAEVRFDENLVLTRFRVDRDATTGTSINVTLEFKQLRVVSTARAAVPAIRAVQVPQEQGTTPAAPAGTLLQQAVHSDFPPVFSDGPLPGLGG